VSFSPCACPRKLNAKGYGRGEEGRKTGSCCSSPGEGGGAEGREREGKSLNTSSKESNREDGRGSAGAEEERARQVNTPVFRSRIGRQTREGLERIRQQLASVPGRKPSRGQRREPTLADALRHAVTMAVDHIFGDNSEGPKR
jgi:hypothetical protein